MKSPSSFLKNRGNIDFDSAMTPMIDVVFLLLVFFVWTASFKIAEHILPSEMTSQAGSDASQPVDPPPKTDFENIVIRIGWDGASPIWSINDQQVDSLQVVRERLQAVAAIQSEAPVILHPQSAVPLDFVIAAYDAAKGAGFAKIAFAVNPPKK